MPGSASACSRVSGRPGTRASESALIDSCLVVRQGVDADHDRPELSLVIAAESNGQKDSLDSQPTLERRQVVLLVLRAAGHPLPPQRAPLKISHRYALWSVVPRPGDPAVELLRVG